MPTEMTVFAAAIVVVAAALFQWVVISPDQPGSALLRTLVACGGALILRWPFARA